MEPLPLVHIEEGVRCFACGPEAKAGLGAQFFLAGDHVEGRWVATEALEGWAGLVHGAGFAALHDDAAAWAMIAVSGNTGFTTRMDVRYRKPIRLGQEVRVVARPAKVDARGGTFTSEIRLPDGSVASTAEVEFAFVDAPTLQRMLGGKPISAALHGWLEAPREQRVERLLAWARERAAAAKAPPRA